MKSNLTDLMRAALAECPFQRLFVGFSGGLDSTVLLHASLALNADPTAVHVNHGLHEQADTWESQCADVCRRLGAAFLSRRVAVGHGGEAGARQARYGAFEELLGDGDLLLLGHHRDDQAETVLLRLVQGRAPVGMPRTRVLHGGGRILRPWLTIPRAALLHWAREAGLDWIDDPTNAQLDFDRNYLRHQILPELACRWPRVGQVLASGAAANSARDSLLAYLMEAYRDGSEVLPGEGSEPPVPDRASRWDAVRLRVFPNELRLPVLRLWLNQLGEFSVADRALSEFIRQLDAPADAHPRLSLQRGELQRQGSKAIYIRQDFELRSSYPLDLPGVLWLPHGELVAQAHCNGFHATGPVEVRFRQGGERLRSGGKTRSVKRLLHGAGVPGWQRYTWPLIYSDSRLLAIPGVAAADSPNREPRWFVSWRPHWAVAGTEGN